MNKITAWLSLLLFTVLLAGCGGGSGGDAAPVTPATYTISGSVSGAVTTGVTVSLTGASSATTTTDATGAYSFTGLVNGAYTVTASKTGYAFSPASVAVSVSGANATGTNFVASVAANTYSLSGTVNGTGNSGVTITLSGGVNSGTTITDGTGAYTFSGLVAGSTTVTPSKSGYTFTPTSSTVNLAANSTGNNFTAAAIPVTYSISGTVSGNISAGVTMNLTGAATASTITSAGGTYTFAGLANGNYTVTPAANGNTFTPASSNVTISNANNTTTNFTSAAVVIPPITISGQVTGVWRDQITMTISGGGGTVTTNASGNYASGSLAGGQSYTVTPSLAGYTFTPPSVTTSTTTTTANFVAASAALSSSITGNVNYAGNKTGRVYIQLQGSSTYGNPGTSIALTSGTGAYAVRGVQPWSYPATYTLNAFMDTLGNGYPNASDPAGTATVTLNSQGAASMNITLTDPAAPTPNTTAVNVVFPMSGGAVVIGQPDMAANGVENSTGYRYEWSTSSNFASIAGSLDAVADRGNNPHFVYNLINGSAYYFRVTSKVGGTASAPSAAFGPVTIGAGTGPYTVSGTLTFPPAAAGKTALVAVHDNGGILRTTSMTLPSTSPANYTISGVPSGNLQPFAFIDMNGNGQMDLGDLESTESNNDISFAVTGNTTGVNHTMLAGNGKARVKTTHFSNGIAGQDSFWTSPDIGSLSRMPVAATVYSAPNVVVPLDLAIDPNNNAGALFAQENMGNTAPVVGDSYKIRVTYSDGFQEDLTASVTGVLSSSNFAQNPAPNASTASGQTTPTFTWAAPAAAPAGGYGYQFGVGNYGTSLPSTATSISPGLSFPVGTPFQWYLTVMDSNKNQAMLQITYTP